MLRELFTYATAKCPPYARGMGYLYEAVATQARHERNRIAWEPHCERTKRFVLSGAERCAGRGTAFVLGSGILSDVPLEELSALYSEVALVDVVHLPSVRRKAGAFRNVRLIELDVTGAAEALFASPRGAVSLPSGSHPLASLAGASDYVVSLNILSQLTVVPERHAAKRLRGVPATHVDQWCFRVVQAHWEALASLPCPVCLVSDYSYTKRAPGGGVLETGGTLRGLPTPAPDAAWTWRLAPLGELSGEYSMDLDVGAWNIR